MASLVAEQNLDHIDLLVVDAEGYDAEVVRMALEMPVRPICIECEHSHIPPKSRAPLFDLLEAKKYSVGYDRWNLFAIQSSVLERWKDGKN